MHLIGGIAPFGFIGIVAGWVHTITPTRFAGAVFRQEMEFEFACVIDNGGKTEKLFFESFSQKPLETTPLDLNQVRESPCGVGIGKTIHAYLNRARLLGTTIIDTVHTWVNKADV